MKKYKINKQFGIYRYLTLPFNKLSFFVSKCSNTFLFWHLKGNDQISIQKEKHSHLKLLIFNPVCENPQKTLLYFHGGAFVFKSNQKHFNLCKRYALEGNCQVVLVDYCCAPKYQYPHQLQDCIMAYQWILKRKKKPKIIIGGDSAGGLLAIDLTLEIIKNNFLKPEALMLIYPLIDSEMASSSMKKFSNTPIWNSKLNKKMWNLYLGNHSYISPMNQKELKYFPTTYVETAEFDCLHDEGLIFANKLKQLKIKVRINETYETMHAFDIKNCSITEKAIEERIKFLKNH